MARAGYFGEPIFRPGSTVPTMVDGMTVARVPRAIGLAQHVANVKRQNIVLDAAVVVARLRKLVGAATKVAVTGAHDQFFGATAGQHAAHAVKRYTFDGRDLAAVYAAGGADEVAVRGLRTMLGLVTDVDRRANLSIDKRLEGNPRRLAQIETAVRAPLASLAAAQALAADMEFQRRFFERALLQSLHGGFGGDAAYGSMLAQYETVLCAPPPPDEAPGGMVSMIARLFDT